MRKLIYPCLGLVLCVLSVATQAQTVIVERENGAPPPAQMGISPPQIEQSLAISKGEVLNQSVVLYNYNPKPKKVSIELIDTDKSRQPIVPNKTTLLPFTIINPTEFVIPGNGQQTIRLSIRPPHVFPQKTHYAVLQITQQVEDSVTRNDEGVVLKFGSSYALPVTITTE